MKGFGACGNMKNYDCCPKEQQTSLEIENKEKKARVDNQRDCVIDNLDGRLTPSLDVDPKLEFAIFCIESVASRLKVSPAKVYIAMTEQSDVLKGYIWNVYDVLHTQGKSYIVDDILAVMKSKGVKL